jgi:NADPH:quinone reductase-like Zn-dependent oxidoreductase
MMQQIWIPKIGGPEVLTVRDAPDPQPAAGEVRLKVTAAGVNFADIMARMGLYPDAPPLPTVVGYEVAGVVDAVGEGVDPSKVGDRALALTRFGGYTSSLCVPAAQAITLPDNISDAQAAAIPVNYLTAWLMLIHLGNVQRGQRVLVHAAAGGVGQAALQLCLWRGAEVIGTASAGKHARLKELGVSHCIDYHTQDFEAEVKRLTNGEGVDIVLDAVGGESYRKSYRSLRAMGRLFCFGASSFAPGQRRSLWAAAKGLLQTPRFGTIPLMNDNRGVFGVNLGHLWDRADELQAMMREIVALTAQGVLAPVVDQVFPFSQAAQAHAYIQAHKNFGKVLLSPDPAP